MTNNIMTGEYSDVVASQMVIGNLAKTLATVDEKIRIDEMRINFKKVRKSTKEIKHDHYLKMKKQRMIDGINKRFVLLSKPDQIQVLVQLNNIFLGR
jgi:hypothetical protein